MQPNPYSPPASTELEVRPSESPSPRPIAVWLMLVVLTAVALLFVVGTAVFLRLVLPHSSELHVGPLIVAVVWRLALIAVAMLAILSTYRRRGWARWLGLAVIVALAAWSILAPDHAQYPNDAERFGALTGRYFIFPALLAGWAYAFGFSAKAKRYFSKADGT